MAKSMFWLYISGSAALLVTQLILHIPAPFWVVLSMTLAALLVVAIVEYYWTLLWVIAWFVIMVQTGDDGGMMWLWGNIQYFFERLCGVHYGGSWRFVK